MRTILLAAALTLTSQAARADYDGSSFGDQGVIVPSGVVGFDFTSTNIGGDTNSVITFQISPRLMYFLSDDFAIGGDLSIYILKAGDADVASSFGIGPRAGFNLRINDSLSWFPNVGLQIVTGGGTTRLPMDIEAPFLIHFGNFFVGVGPALAFDIWGKVNYEAPLGGEDSVGYRLIVFRLTTSLGGWIPTGGGDWDDVMPPPDADPHTAPPPPPPAEETPPTPANDDEWT